MATKKQAKQDTANDERFIGMTEYMLDVMRLAQARGIPNAYGLWKEIGGSMESANDIWNGKTKSISFKMLSRLCHVLRCSPSKLFAKVEAD